MSRWEYQILSHAMHPQTGRWEWSEPGCSGKYIYQILNEYGEEGWELVATTVEAHSIDGERAGVTTGTSYIFKRPKG